MREKVADAQPRMDGGLNSISSDGVLLPNQLRKATNARLTEFGAIQKRGGTKRTAAALNGTNDVRNGFTWRQDGGTIEVLAISGATLYTSSYGTYPWTWTAQSGTLATTGTPYFARFRDTGGNDVVYIGDGGLLNKWDGTTLTTDISGTSTTKNIVVHNQRLWGCGCGTNPQSIFYSSLNNGDTLGNAGSGGGEIIVRTFGDETVIALASINTSLLIFHRQGISRLTGYGQSDITVQPEGVSSDVGTIAAGSVVPVENIAYFVSERGLYRCNESEVAPVSSQETPDPLLPLIRQLSASQFDNIRAVLNRATREVWISIPGYGVYVYHTTLNAWAGPWDTGYISPDTTALWESYDDNELPIILKGDGDSYVSITDAPAVFLDNVNSDDTGGDRYVMEARFHRLYAGDQALSKAMRWGYLEVDLRGSDQSKVEWRTGEFIGSFELPVSTASSWGGFGTIWGTGTWGGGGRTSYRIPMGGNGYYVDVSFIDSGAALPVVSSFQLEAFALGRR
jgi:hypothetical protein